MMNDMKESPATVLCIQEMTAASCEDLEMDQKPPSGPSVVRKQQDDPNQTARTEAKGGNLTR